MNGPIAQLAALTCHANAFLGGRDIPNFFASNSTCQFCNRIEFVEIRGRASGNAARHVVADSPNTWIHDLPLRDVDGVRVTFEPRNDPNISDRMSAGFAGGGRVWRMIVIRDDGQSEVWSDEWRVTNQDAPDRRIWQVTYRLESTAPSRAYAGRNLTIVKSTFRDSLEEILDFSRGYAQGAFSTSFEEALMALDDHSVDVDYHKDIAMPGQLNPDAESLLKASMCAWVFGGMGSWNDMSFDEPAQTEYENVSDRLFQVVHEAIEASITSTYLES